MGVFKLGMSCVQNVLLKCVGVCVCCNLQEPESPPPSNLLMPSSLTSLTLQFGEVKGGSHRVSNESTIFL